MAEAEREALSNRQAADAVAAARSSLRRTPRGGARGASIRFMPASPMRVPPRRLRASMRKRSGLRSRNGAPPPPPSTRSLLNVH